jgi:hypothetical protein
LALIPFFLLYLSESGDNYKRRTICSLIAASLVFSLIFGGTNWMSDDPESYRMGMYAIVSGVLYGLGSLMALIFPFYSPKDYSGYNASNSDDEKNTSRRNPFLTLDKTSKTNLTGGEYRRGAGNARGGSYRGSCGGNYNGSPGSSSSSNKPRSSNQRTGSKQTKDRGATKFCKRCGAWITEPRRHVFCSKACSEYYHGKRSL